MGARHPGHGQQRAQAGRKTDEVRAVMEEQRPVAEAIAAKRQAARRRVPISEGERPETPRHTGVTPALEDAQQQRGIGSLRQFGAGGGPSAPPNSSRLSRLAMRRKQLA